MNNRSSRFYKTNRDATPRSLPHDESSPKCVLLTIRCNYTNVSRVTCPYIHANWRSSTSIAAGACLGGNGTDSFHEIHFIDWHLHLRTLWKTPRAMVSMTRGDYFFFALRQKCIEFADSWSISDNEIVISMTRTRSYRPNLHNVKTVFRISSITKYMVFVFFPSK